MCRVECARIHNNIILCAIVISSIFLYYQRGVSDTILYNVVDTMVVFLLFSNFFYLTVEAFYLHEKQY